MCKQVEGFLNYMDTVKNCSKQTIDGYRIDLNVFMNYIKNLKQINRIEDETFKNINLNDMYSFLSYLQKERNNSPSSRCRKINALKSFFKYLKLTNIIYDNITEQLQKPKIVTRNKEYLTFEESEKLLESIDEWDINYSRDYAIIYLFLNTGIRVSELCDIKLDDIKNYQLVILGKGAKERFIPLSEKTILILNRWIEDRKRKKIKEGYEEYLFISRIGKNISKNSVENMVNKYIKKSGVNPNAHCHSLRKAFAVNTYKATNNNLRVVQELLGHNSANTTALYTIVSNDDLREAIEKNPFNKI